MRHTTFLTLLLCLAAGPRLLAEEIDNAGGPTPANVAVTEIGNGIWRVRFGTPEAFVPTRFRSGAVQAESLKRLPAVAQPPFAISDIEFATGPRGVVVSLPMSESEQVYGMGLSTKEFDKSGKRVALIPSDNPEMEGGPSHAPVPFYVSTAGYGVFVDTARYTTFRAGTTIAAPTVGYRTHPVSSPPAHSGRTAPVHAAR